MNKHGSSTIWVAISHHGFGHLGQIAPVLNRLVSQGVDLTLIIQSGHPRVLLERFLKFAFVHVEHAADQPLLMKNAITLDIPATVTALQAYHLRTAEEIALLTALMQRHQVSLVISNIGYFPLVAANALKLPSIAFCSLNWADILSAYAHLSADLPPLIAVIKHCYAAAEVFLAPQPAMPMPAMNDVISVGPVARGGRSQSLAKLLQHPASTRYGLVSLGGISYPLHFQEWPSVDGWVWIAAGVENPRPDLIDLQQLTAQPGTSQQLTPQQLTPQQQLLEFTDVLSSVDLLVTKPGYGNITEAGCAGIPVACLPRPDWPETAALLDWLQQKVPVLMIEETPLISGQCLPDCAHWRDALAYSPLPSIATGVQEVVNHILTKSGV